jgi:hypothetical protein
MNDKLDLPPELAHLLEKREQEDRRASAESAPPIVDSPVADDSRPASTEHGERRSGVDRRRS